MPSKVTLKDSDWAALFPTDEFELLEGVVLYLQPLSVKQLGFVIDKLSTILDEARKTFESTPNTPTELDPEQEELSRLLSIAGSEWRDASNIVDVAYMVVKKAPEIVSEMSGLDKSDVERLPINKAVELFNACVETNLKDKERLSQNLGKLARNLGSFTGGQIQPETEAPKIKRAMNAEA